MLTVKELKPNVYELTLRGVLEKSDTETMARKLAPALKGDQPVSLIVRAEGWKDITADVLAEDMKFEFGLLPRWAKIARMAIVTDLQAFSALLKWIDPIFSIIEMRSFAASDVAAAEAFASELPERGGAAQGSGITLLADASNGIVVFEVDGRITGKDVDAALLTDGSTMGSKFGMIGHLKRYAVVGAPSWMQGLVSAMGPAMPFEMKDETAAREWVGWS